MKMGDGMRDMHNGEVRIGGPGVSGLQAGAATLCGEQARTNDAWVEWKVTYS